jgi:hypothetical protein
MNENKTNTTGLYFLQAGSAKSAWKKWQVETFRVAQKHDRCIFSKQGILDLYAELVEHARAFRNYQEGDIRQPDFVFAEKLLRKEQSLPPWAKARRRLWITKQKL